jgi:hypothetical protein
MAADWIKMRSNLKDDPDVIMMACKLGIDEFGICGRLHAVWSWLDQHSTTGTGVRITSAYLDRLTACPGFAEAMRAVDWLRGRDGDLEFPDFEIHNGESAKVRASEQKKKQRQRMAEKERDKCPNVSGTNVPESVPEKSGLEKRREESKRYIDPAGLSPTAPCSIEQAVEYGGVVKMTREQAQHWWHVRNAAGWTKGSTGGGAPRKITSWQSDMATSVSWVGESQAKSKTASTATEKLPATNKLAWEK